MILKKRNKISKIVYNFGYDFYLKKLKKLVCENCQMIIKYFLKFIRISSNIKKKIDTLP
jgi:hypothetical protein